MKRAFAAIVMTAVALLAPSARAETFAFAALGDLGYRLPRDAERYTRLTDAVNRAQPAFTIHVGDFKGYTSCADADLLASTRFERFESALILTPGDNDWADCYVESAGGFEPLERLAALRRLYFWEDASRGARPIPLLRQTGAPENARWTRGGVVFATLHVTGPANNVTLGSLEVTQDAFARVNAGKVWLAEAFAAALETSAPALVIAFHADLWTPGAATYEDGPLDWIRQIVREQAASYHGQVLLVHGDSHRLIVDQPFRRADIEAGSTEGLNITRLQVPGWPDHRGVLVSVDTESPGVFGFTPIVPIEEARGAQR